MTDAAPKPSSKRPLLGVLALSGAVLVIVLAVWLAKRQPAATPAEESTTPQEAGTQVSPYGTTVYGAPAATAPVAMAALAAPPAPSIIVDVLQPGAVYDVLKSNAWLDAVLQKPVGQGFLGTWAGFLGTKGEDIRAGFSGMVLDFLAGKMLATPFRVVWFAGAKVTGSPAIVVPAPGDAALAAYAALDAAAGRGTLTVERCLDPEAAANLPEDAPKVRSLDKITVRRWLLADHALYAASQGDRIVLAKRPAAVLQGLCAELGRVEPVEGAAFQIELRGPTLGRAAQVFPKVLGIHPAPRLAFGVEGDRIVPKGIVASVATQGHLGQKPASEKLLRLIPEDVPVVLVADLLLPTELSATNLEDFFRGDSVATTERQVAVVWYPRGREDAPPEMAILWSRVDDQEKISELFNGLVTAGEPACDHLVLTMGPEILDRLEKSCSGKSPSLLQAGPAVVQGFKSPLSLAVGVHLGRMLTHVTADAYAAEHDVKSPVPPEIQEVQRQLAELPFFGLRGVIQGQALVPGGFRS